MNTLLKIELKKLLPYRSFWAAVIAYVLMMGGLFASLYRFKLNINSVDIGINFYYFPDIWHNIAYITSWFNVLLYFFVILIVTNEYQFRTVRQNVIDGLSRWQSLTGKILLLLLFSIGTTVLVGLVTLACGFFLADTDSNPFSLEKIEYLGLYFIQTLGISSFALLVANLLRKQGMSIIAFLGYILIGEPVLRYRLLPESWGEYLPMQALGQLIPNPLPAYFNLGTLPEFQPTLLLASLMYTALFFAASGWVLQSRDL
ncbi:MAG: hypothetical protein IGS03_05460 [Candidatus Sericytochromatia bacterium]|nr:hypothetical protein [Candidatus Sericytochromatia bacterium]